MLFKSTRKSTETASFSKALCQPLAENNGLWVPTYFPKIAWQECQAPLGLKEIAKLISTAFFQNDPLIDHIENIVENTFTFDIPIELLPGTIESSPHFLLNLTKGPTAAFKDIGARFLANCLSSLNQITKDKQYIVLVATSGDTGGAVASAFFKQAGVQVIILYPKDKISPVQETQLTCWMENIHSFSVNGTFDDCQRMVKEVFEDSIFTKENNLISANSINIGRILPQTFYYAYSSVWYWKKYHTLAPYIIPTGNLGNALACFWAKEMGFPIGKITLACNDNLAVPQYFKHHKMIYTNAIPTIANAMDVGKPSNLERLAHLYQYPCPSHHKRLLKDAEAISVSNQQIQQHLIWAAKDQPAGWGKILCPHTAVGIETIKRQIQPVLLVATADPAKFPEVLHQVGINNIPQPSSLRDLLQKETHVRNINSQSSMIKEYIKDLYV